MFFWGLPNIRKKDTVQAKIQSIREDREAKSGVIRIPWNVQSFIGFPIVTWLVVWNIFVFPFSWQFHNPNWFIFFRSRYTTNQPVMVIASVLIMVMFLHHHYNWCSSQFDGINHSRKISSADSVNGLISRTCCRNWGENTTRKIGF